MRQHADKQIPWLRIVVEGATIVASILLAFGIEAWWSERQERDEESSVLLAVLDDARANIAALEEARIYHRAALDREREILALVDAGSTDLPLARADTLLADLVWWYGSNQWQTGGIDALTQGGRLDLISDEALRTTLVSWNKNVARVRLIEEEEGKFFNGLLMPYLHREARVPQIAEIANILPGSDFDAGYGRVDFSGERTDHRPLLLSSEFQNLVLHKLWIQTDILGIYDEFHAELVGLVDLLERELGEN